MVYHDQSAEPRGDRGVFQGACVFRAGSGAGVLLHAGHHAAIGYDGKLLLAEKDSLSLSPNGHGGTLLALRKSGALARMEAEKTDCISYFQVDNPLIPVVNPFFLGMHDLEKSEMSAIMLAKTGRLKSSATSA